MTCNDPGYTRRRAGRGFVYVDVSGARVADAEVLTRIRALAIPPAWTDVWICTDEVGHLGWTSVILDGMGQFGPFERMDIPIQGHCSYPFLLEKDARYFPFRGVTARRIADNGIGVGTICPPLKMLVF